VAFVVEPCCVSAWLLLVIVLSGWVRRSRSCPWQSLVTQYSVSFACQGDHIWILAEGTPRNISITAESFVKIPAGLESYKNAQGKKQISR
jgi:hypothetical protein